MSTLEQNIQQLIDNKINIKAAIENKLDGEITGNMSQWSDIIATIGVNEWGYGDHCDEHGIWHKPDEWPDIESLPIPNNTDIVYLLYDNNLIEQPYASFTVNRSTGTLVIDRGHIENGEFVVDENLHSSGSGNKTINKWLDTTEDYTIFRIQSTGISSVVTAQMQSTSNPPTYHAQKNPCVMRYGQMRSGTAATFRSYFLESDNIINFCSARTGYSVSLANCYNGNYRMQRWRNTGWNIKNNNLTSMAAMFATCVLLSDYSYDFDGWIKSSCTTLSQAFNLCPNIKKLKLTNWDTSSVTETPSMFANCAKLEQIIGIETWNLSNVTNLASMFIRCHSLYDNFDLSNWQISNKCKNVSNFMAYANNVQNVSIAEWDLSEVTTCTMMFGHCINLKSVDMTDITPITNVCTNTSLIFAYCMKLKEVEFNGWDFSGISGKTNTAIYQMIMSCSCLETLNFIDCIWPTSLTSQNNSYYIWGGNNFHLKTLYCPDLDARIFTSAQLNQAGCLNALTYAENVTPPNHICKNLNISACYALTHQSLLNILNALDTVTGTVTLTLGFHRANLSAEEIAIATNKGWTIA